ncbi:MAG: sigma-70 family RNA polymerase sigma factor [Chloroflexi bacterium]|nr:sigma-70 family RNA polymerase sigma factor [Chloroflexota bacterium]
MTETANISPPTGLDDQEMWQRLLDRDGAVWAALQQQLIDWVYTYLRPRLYWMAEEQVQECARECTQAACERILRGLHLYRGEGSLLGWCRVVSLRVTIDWIRRDRRDRLAAPAPLTEESGQPDDPTARIEQALEIEKIQALIDAFVETNLSQREQMVLREAETDAGVLAARLGITANNLYQIRHRALGKVRRHLESQGYTRQRLAEWGLL